MRRSIAFVFCLVGFASPNLRASATEGVWIGLFSQQEQTESIGIHQEFQVRKNTETGKTAQSLFRAGPLWKLNEFHSLGLLYAHVSTGPLIEHRLSQQHIFKWTNQMSLRTRLEQRFFEKTNGMDLRLRLQLRYEHALNESFKVFTWNEYFIHSSNTAITYDHIFDRNRFFLGFKTAMHKISIDVGYLNQYTNRSGADLTEHLMVIYFNY